MSQGHGESGGEMIDRARANREASNWLVLLQEDPDDEALCTRFRLWLAESPTNATAWAEAGRISHVIRTASPAYADHWQKPRARVIPILWRRRSAGAPHSRPIRHVGKVAAAAVAACLAIVAGPELLMRIRADALSGAGQTEVVHLQDGSVVTLAPQSAVAYHVRKGGQREVRLLRGRAFFDVARDPAHPFRVVTAGTTTMVLGTAFEVQNRGNDDVSVAVRHGLVKVSCENAPGRDERLSASDALQLSCDTGARGRTTIEPARIATWVDGRIVASDRPVAEVIDALRPWYTGIIMMRGAGFGTRRVTGVYDARQPERVLHKLAQSNHLTLRQITPWVTVLTAD